MSTVEQTPPQQKTTYTPEDLLVMPNGEDYELVDGHLVERNMSLWSSWTGGKAVRLLGNFAREHRQGWVLPADCGYQCFPDAPKKVRKPDGSFISFARLPAETADVGHVRIAPDLIVEVVSPNDAFDDVGLRIEDFLKAGVKLAWLISPRLRTVQVFRSDGTSQVLREGDDLTGENVLPGFRCPVVALLPPSAAAVVTT